MVNGEFYIGVNNGNRWFLTNHDNFFRNFKKSELYPTRVEAMDLYEPILYLCIIPNCGKFIIKFKRINDKKQLINKHPNHNGKRIIKLNK